MIVKSSALDLRLIYCEINCESIIDFFAVLADHLSVIPPRLEILNAIFHCTESFRSSRGSGGYIKMYYLKISFRRLLFSQAQWTAMTSLIDNRYDAPAFL